MTPTPVCELCGISTIPSWTTRDADGHVWPYVRCPACGLVRLGTGPGDRAWEKQAYPENYYGGGYSKFSGAIQTLREFSAWRRAREIHGFFQKPGRVLDIGCGEGLFLKSMKSLGWEVSGCEIGEQAADRAERNIGAPIHRGDFKTLPDPGKPWDVIMLWHVLEHLERPARFLEHATKKMSPDGLLIVAIPNADSWQARFFGSDWFHLDPPRHLHSMTCRHLEGMAAQAGCRLQATHHFSLEYNPYGWAQSLLNALGFPRDAMYENLKPHRSPSSFPLRMLAWLLLAPSILPALAEASVGRGGCICGYLRKKKEF